MLASPKPTMSLKEHQLGLVLCVVLLLLGVSPGKANAPEKPALLRQAGYRVGFVGKFGVVVSPGATKRMHNFYASFPPTPVFHKQADGSERHLTDVEGDKAIVFLDSLKPGEPFCLSLWFNAPHAIDNDPRQYIWPAASPERFRPSSQPDERSRVCPGLAGTSKAHHSITRPLRRALRAQPGEKELTDRC